MGGLFGVVSKDDCSLDVFFGVDYHSHLGTRRGGIAIWREAGHFQRAIHNIQNSPFRTKFENDIAEMKGQIGIGALGGYYGRIWSHSRSVRVLTWGISRLQRWES